MKKSQNFYGQPQILNQSQIDLLDKDKIIKKDPNKNELIESYIDGELELFDLLDQLESLKDKKGFKRSGNKKLSEMHGNLIEENKNNRFNRTAFVNYNDFIKDLDMEDTPQGINENNISPHKFASNMQQSHQQTLNQMRQTYFLFDKKLNLEEMGNNQMMVNKSYTMNINIQKPMITQNLGLKRRIFMPEVTNSKTCLPVNIVENENVFMEDNINKSISVHKGENKRKKQCQNILTKRNMPYRICKVNISYTEKVNDKQFEKLINGGIINF